MHDEQAEDVLRRLRSKDPREGWTRFLELYSPLLFDLARRFERDEEAVADCYLFVCEELAANRFRRLLRFRPDGPARFSTWLCAVGRNLCLDWHRREFGRHRVFESVARLPALDQEVFRGLFVEGLPIEDVFLEVAPRHPGLTLDQVAASARRVQGQLGPRQRWLLAVRRMRGAPAASAADPAEDDSALLRVPSEMPNPETWAGLQEERAALLQAMSRLSPRERLLVRLRFDRELTLAEIARLLNLDNAQAVDRRIREVVEKLRAAMGRRAPGR